MTDNVIPFKRKDGIDDLIAHLEELLERAKAGNIKRFITMIDDGSERVLQWHDADLQFFGYTAAACQAKFSQHYGML